MFSGFTHTRATSGGPPVIDRENTILKGGKKELQIVGENFQPGAQVEMETAHGLMQKGQLQLIDSNHMVINGVGKTDFPDGMATITVRNPDGTSAKETLAIIPSAIGPSPLSQGDIEQIIGQAAAACQKLNVAGRFAILDREGNILALYVMKGATSAVFVRDLGQESTDNDTQGLEGLGGPNFLSGATEFVALSAPISKAGTGAFLSTQGNAFTTRTAAYIIREHIPPFITNMPGGPLFGVQVSSLGCSDIKQPGLPLGMSGDTGGVPIYKNGIMAGGFGVEINGQYNVALNRPEDLGRSITPSSDIYQREGIEEMVAFAAVTGFEAPDAITADKLLINGIRLPYRAMFDIPQVQAIPFNQIGGKLLPIPPIDPATGTFSTKPGEIRTGVPTEFRDIMLRDRHVRVVNRFFPPKNSRISGLSSSDVEQMLYQGTVEANRVRAAIRRPLEVAEEVNITVEDVDGTILGIVSTPDAPIFGFDVAVEKGRSGLFFSQPNTPDLLRSIEDTNSARFNYAENLAAQGLNLTGEFMFTARSVGWIARPFYPDGITDRESEGPGPLSVPEPIFSPLNNGFQTDYLLKGGNLSESIPKLLDPNHQIVIVRSIVDVLAGLDTGDRTTPGQTSYKKMHHYCDALNGKGAGHLIDNTLMIFTGCSLVFKDGHLAGAVGISGDGIDQDDITGSYGSAHFEVPPERRVDRLFFRGIRIPYTKFPRHPHLGL